MKKTTPILSSSGKPLGNLHVVLDPNGEGPGTLLFGYINVQDEHGVVCAVLNITNQGASLANYRQPKESVEPKGQPFFLSEEYFPTFHAKLLERLGQCDTLRTQNTQEVLRAILDETQEKITGKRSHNAGPQKIKQRHDRVPVLFPDKPGASGGYIDILRDEKYLTRHADYIEAADGGPFIGTLKCYKYVEQKGGANDGGVKKAVHIATIEVGEKKDTLQVHQEGYKYGTQLLDIPRVVGQTQLREDNLLKPLIAQLGMDIIHKDSNAWYSAITDFFNDLDCHRNALEATGHGGQTRQ